MPTKLERCVRVIGNVERPDGSKVASGVTLDLELYKETAEDMYGQEIPGAVPLWSWKGTARFPQTEKLLEIPLGKLHFCPADGRVADFFVTSIQQGKPLEIIGSGEPPFEVVGMGEPPIETPAESAPIAG